MRHRIVRRVEALAALATALLIAAAVAWSYAVELRGPYVDAIASDLASRRFGLPVTVLDVRVRHWHEVRFGLATVGAPGGRTLVACGSGEIVFREWAFLKGDVTRATIRLKDVALLEDLYRHWSMSAWAAGSAFNDPIFVRRLEATFADREAYYEAHVHAFDSDEIELAGGIRWAGRKFLKANVLVLVSDSKIEKVPKELRARMIHRRPGWNGFRVSYAAGSLTVYGSSGPFFSAHWAA